MKLLNSFSVDVYFIFYDISNILLFFLYYNEIKKKVKL